MVYQGNGSTYTAGQQDIQQVSVDNYGYELCYIYVVDEDWSEHTDSPNGWYAYAAGSGWAMLGECTGLTTVTLGSESVHPVWEYPDFDLVETDAYDNTPW